MTKKGYSAGMATPKKKGKPENLKPPLSPEEARTLGKKGGIKSGEVRAEKKRMSQIYADVLARRYDVDGEMVEGPVFIAGVVKAILERQDSASVSLLKEIREATEGSKLSLSGADGEDLFKAFADAADAKVRRVADLKDVEI